MKLVSPKSLATLTALVGLTVAALGFGGGASSAATGAINLKGICPDTVVIQTDWFPESDHSESYAIAASNGTIDAKKKTYTADLIANGKPTGVKVQIRAGGPATGYQTPTQQMYTDDSIYMGYANTDESIQNSGTHPTLSVFAPREHWAQVLIFDPKTYPKLTSIKGIKATGATVYYFKGNVYMDYLIGAGILDKDKTNSSYDGSPTALVTSGGKNIAQGFITAEPYNYEHLVKNWMKPVKALSIEASGYPNYGETLAIRKKDLAKDTPCLKLLVPILQQAQVDYAKSPARVDTLLDKINADFVKNGKSFWNYNKAQADYGAKTQVADKIISNGRSRPRPSATSPRRRSRR